MDNKVTHNEYIIEEDTLTKPIGELTLKYRRKTPKKINKEEFMRKREAERKARLERYPEKLKKLINEYETLNEDERRAFGTETSPHFFYYEDYDYPQTTKEDTKELLETLVQTCIDFINERQLKDIECVSFRADALQASAEEGEWTPSTDASVLLLGEQTVKSSDGDIDFPVYKKINEYF